MTNITDSKIDDRTGRVLELVDLIADSDDVEQEDLLKDALSRVRKRGSGE